MMVALKDIAQTADVARGMVSRILNQNPTLYVTGETRERVTHIIEFLDYKRSTLRTTSSAPTEQGKRIDVVQIFDMEELQEGIYYLALKNILDEECFSR